MRATWKNMALAAILASVCAGTAAGQDGARRSIGQGAWAILPGFTPSVRAQEPWLLARNWLEMAVDMQQMRASLALAPHEQAEGAQGVVLTLPNPDGILQRFDVRLTDLMHADLAAKFPDIRTYVGQGIDTPAAMLRLSVDDHGLHAQVLQPAGTWYIDPIFRGDMKHHASYWRSDLVPMGDATFQCLTAHPEHEDDNGASPLSGNDFAPVTLRTYMTAVGATGEFTQWFGGSVSQGLSGVTNGINRVTGILERDAAVRLQLVANNNLLIYTNPSTDPYPTASSSFDLLDINTGILNSVVGSAAYDVGHVVHRANLGGVAYLNAVCNASIKGGGVSTSSSPNGDGFWVNILAHEFGHQFAARHIFNAAGSCEPNRDAGSAYERGSGSTIMSYAGLCGSSNNLQNFADDYYNSRNIEQIVGFVSGAANACSTATATGNNTPTITPLFGMVVPISTPLEFGGQATDPDGDQVTFCWEQRDLGPAQNANAGDNGTSPIIRSRKATLSSTRLIPTLTNLLNNTSNIGEVLPTTNRNITMRFVVRDNKVGGGGVTIASVQHAAVTSAGPFVVLSPNTNVLLKGSATVTWSVANTNVLPVLATTVDILLSTDGGNTFPVVLASATPNDGSQTVTLPSITTSQARIKVKATNNIFFDISNTNFQIQPAACYADCDLNGTLNIFDYICFGNAYSASQSYADCDNSGTFNIFDYICFGNAYSSGCP